MDDNIPRIWHVSQAYISIHEAYHVFINCSSYEKKIGGVPNRILSFQNGRNFGETKLSQKNDYEWQKPSFIFI